MRVSKGHFGFNWKKRIREDNAEVLMAAGAPASNHVALELKDPEIGELKKVPRAEMTNENRSKIKRSS